MGIELGDKVRDRVSSFEGVVVARTEWLNGCIRLSIQPDSLDKDGKVREAQTFDEPQLEIVNARHVVVESAPTGGPVPEPRRHANPVR